MPACVRDACGALISPTSKTPSCQTVLGPASCPKFPLKSLFRFLRQLLSAVIWVDAALFAAAQAGDPVALERMLRELQPDTRRYGRRQGHRTTAIEDVVQEALIVLYRCLCTVRDPLTIAGWIFRVVTRLCMLPVLGLIRGAEELTQRHGAEYFAQLPKDELRIDVVRVLESLPGSDTRVPAWR